MPRSDVPGGSTGSRRRRRVSVRPRRSFSWTDPRVSIRSGLVRLTCDIRIDRVTAVHEESEGMVTMAAFQGAIFDVDGVLVDSPHAVSYTHLRAHETRHDLVCRLLL